MLPATAQPASIAGARCEPWEHQLTLEAIGRWLIRGAIGASGRGSLVLLVGWVTPIARERAAALGRRSSPWSRSWSRLSSP